MTKEAAATEETGTARRSTRIASQPKPPSSAAPPKEKKPRGKKRTTEESASDEPSAEADEDGEAPAKKAKPSSKAATKPASKAAKPASKAAEKPESKTEKPASKAKPASKSKPASKGKPASKAKPASKSKAEGEAAGATDTIMEEPEEAAATEEAAKPAEPEVPAAAEPAPEASEAAKEPGATAETSKEAEAAAEAPAEAASSSAKELQVGDVLPNVTVPNNSGVDVDIGSLAKEKGVVLFVVPKANTPGCTTQACGFRDTYQDFTGLDYAVYALSADSAKVQTSWQTKQTLPYPLLSDPKRTLIGLLGAASGNSIKRSHFIFEKGTGKLVDKQIGIKPAESPKAALEFVKKHAAAS